MTPIDQIEQLAAEAADLRAKLEEATAKITSAASLESDKAALVAKVGELEAAAAKHGEAIASLTKERDDFKARAEKAEGAMALKPEAFEHITDGTKAAKDGAAPAEKPLAEKLSELTAQGKRAEARELYKQHKAEFKRLGKLSPR